MISAGDILNQESSNNRKQENVARRWAFEKLLPLENVVFAIQDGHVEIWDKEYKIHDEYVKVAVRVSGGGTYYARSLYVLNKRMVINFIKKQTLIKY